MNEYFPTVVQVIPLDNFHVQVFFDDGKIVDYDATNDLKAEIMAPMRDIENFKNACTVMNGTLAWDISGKWDEADCVDRTNREITYKTINMSPQFRND